MIYKLAPHVTEEMLVQEGFVYRSWYDNFNFLIICPLFERQLKSTMAYGYTKEQALEENAVKSAYLDYYIQIDHKKREIDIYSVALRPYPYEEFYRQHDIAHEVLAKMIDLISKGMVICE